MSWPRMTMEGMLRQIEGWKKGKAAGPDNVRGEVVKQIVKDNECRIALLEGFNNLFGGEVIPEIWFLSETRMIGKTWKPTVNEFRPIAITSV